MVKSKNRTRPQAKRGLPVVHPHAAGIDVGSRFHVAAVAAERDAEPVRIPWLVCTRLATSLSCRRERTAPFLVGVGRSLRRDSAAAVLDAHESMDGRGTTPRMGEIERSRRPEPRATQEAKAENDECSQLFSEVFTRESEGIPARDLASRDEGSCGDSVRLIHHDL